MVSLRESHTFGHACWSTDFQHQTSAIFERILGRWRGFVATETASSYFVAISPSPKISTIGEHFLLIPYPKLIRFRFFVSWTFFAFNECSILAYRVNP